MALRRAPIFVLPAALLLAGCGNLFNSGFEADPVGGPPGPFPPGPPAGDTIDVAAPQLYTVTSTDPIAGERSLVISEGQAGLDDDPIAVTFRTVSILDAAVRPIYVTWRGRFLARSPGIQVDAGVLNGYFARVRFKDGLVYLFDQPVGTYTVGTTHTVVISMLPKTGTVRLGAFGGMAIDNDFAEARLTVLDGRPTDEGFVEIQPTRAERPRAAYVIDDVRVSSPEE